MLQSGRPAAVARRQDRHRRPARTSPGRSARRRRRRRRRGATRTPPSAFALLRPRNRLATRKRGPALHAGSARATRAASASTGCIVERPAACKTVRDKDGPGGTRPQAARAVPAARRQAPLVRARLRLRRQPPHQPDLPARVAQEQRAVRGKRARKRSVAVRRAQAACAWHGPAASAARDVERRRLAEALQLHLADRLEHERRCGRATASHDRLGHEHLARLGARDHARGEVDVAPVVVAVAVERAAVVDADARAASAARSPPGSRSPSPSARPGRCRRSSRRRRCS